MTNVRDPRAPLRPGWEGLVPRSVAWAVGGYDHPLLGDAGCPADLHPDEFAAVLDAFPRRQREFAAGRRCAHAALVQLNGDVPSIGRRADRAPVWPPGVVGSITHTDGYAAAVVARAGDILGLGIDAERNAPLPDGVLEAVALPQEQSGVAALLRADPSMRWDRALFSAKEAVFKVWHPLAGTWLGFLEVEVSFVAYGFEIWFEARLDRPLPWAGSDDSRHVVRGRLSRRDELLLTAVAIAPWCSRSVDSGTKHR